jgi:hypothetical protein
MQRSGAWGWPRCRGVDALSLNPLKEFTCREGTTSSGYDLIDRGAYLVCDHANLWAIVRWKCADPTKYFGDRAALPEERRAKIIEISSRSNSRNTRRSISLQCAELFLERCEVHYRGPKGLGALRCDRDRRECRGIANSEVGQHLAVNRNVIALEAGDELRIRDAVEPCRRVDAVDPQLTHLALALLSVSRCVGKGVKQGLARWTNELAA